ncbi:STP1 protein [Plasmodium ovale wallikeri]|uniref:STP1 protein n=1 Tax=Plasmodium ovale wallikeri TaxID=864142 RepID=A0A1A9AQX1_PLAOA|nr:STP1 protein [Plasmodium ovale wallikeri]
MAHNSGYSTLTRYIHVDAFISMIERNIKELIRKYGHINCGLRHEELCEELKKFINKTKTPILSLMDEEGKKEWNTKWSKKRNEFFNRLFEEEGFKNTCYPPKKIGNPSLYQLKSKHIQFCKERDVRLSDLRKNSEYSVCREYNMWIDSQRTAFTHEYLINVRGFTSKTVHKYFSTKEHPGGHDPSGTYLKSKLDCKQYNPSLRSHKQIPVAKPHINKQQSSREPNIIQGSQGKDGGSVTDKDSESTETKPEENKSQRPKSHTPNSQILAPSKTEGDGTHTGQATHVISKAPGSPVNRDGEKNESIPTKGKPPTDRLQTARDEALPQAKSPPLPPEVTIPTPAIQSVPAATLTTGKNRTSSKTPVTSSSLTINSDSSLNSGSPSSSDPLPPSSDTKGQDGAPQSTTSSDTLATTRPTQSIPSTERADLSLPPPQSHIQISPSVVNSAKEPGTPASSSVTTVTTTTTSPTALTRPTMITTHESISSAKEATSVFRSQEPHLPSAASEPKATEPTIKPRQTDTQTPTPLIGTNNGRISVPAQPVTDDGGKQTPLSTEASSKHNDTRPKPGVQLPNIISQNSGQKPDKVVVTADAKLPRTKDQADPMHIIYPDQIKIIKNHDQLTPHANADPGKILNVKPGKKLVNNPFTPKEKNNNPNIIPEETPSLTHIIPTLIVILGTVTLLFQLYKYTPFGFLLGRKRKRKKQDLKRIFETPEKTTYESPNIIVHELEDPNLLEQTVKSEEYVKLLKINRYKQEMQKRKKENKKTLIEVHMEVLEEYQNDEWELHKGDFLEICLRGFINEENDTYSKLPNSELTVNNTKKDKTIEDIQKKEILWNNWIENHRNILEQWKKEEWFHMLKNKWRNEEQMYKDKNDKLQENILNEQETHSIVNQKDIWKQWISKQATLIKMFNQEVWFKELVYAQDKEKDNYRINEYNNNTITTETQLKNEKSNHEHCRSENIIQKLMVQIHMMVLEECIKDEIIRNKELSIDNFIQDIHKQNNYDEK